MQFNQHEMVDIQKKLQDSLRVIKMYEWLLDSYVLVSEPVYSKIAMKYFWLTHSFSLFERAGFLHR